MHRERWPRVREEIFGGHIALIQREARIHRAHSLIASNMIAFASWDPRLASIPAAAASRIQRIGKTRVAQQVLYQLGSDFPQGVAWADLSGVSDPARLADALTEAVGVGPRYRQIREYLAFYPDRVEAIEVDIEG